MKTTQSSNSGSEHPPFPWTIIRNILWWALASLIAIAIVETNGPAGLAAALVGGIILGFLLLR